MNKPNPSRILSRGGAGTRVIPETAVAFDLPDDTQEPNAAVKAPSDPVGLAARLMLETALNANPDSREMFRKEGLAVVVEVPSACWITPISEALYELASVATACLETDKESDFQNYFDVNWMAIKADSLKSAAERAKIDAAVVRAIADGVTVAGFSQAPNRFLPPSLLRAADHRIVVSPLSSVELAYAVSQMLGGAPEESLSPRLCRLIDTDDLRLAKRPEQSPGDFLSRLRRLVESKIVKSDLTLDNLAGMDEAVRWGHALAKDLGEYAAGRLRWADVDRGVLLAGPPGTGKTTYAKALAGTCDVTLIAASLYQWQSKGHLGDLQKAMRETFEQARKAAPCILLIDELDSLGDRDSFAHDNREYSVQVVNGFLEELDGVAGREGVVVIGATNSPDRIDAAITRSGRLDRIIRIGLPDEDGLVGILRHHLASDLRDADLADAVRLLIGCTGADVESAVRGARRRARSADRAMLIDDLIEEIRGPVKAPGELTWCRAVHEAGHAVAWAVLFPRCLVNATIRETADNGGSVCAMMPHGPYTRDVVLGLIRVNLAGRAAEDVVLGTVTTGSGGSADSDLAKASALAVDVVGAFGLDGDLLWTGSAMGGGLDRISPETADRARDILDEEYVGTAAMIRNHRNAVEVVAKMLVENMSVSATQVEDVVFKLSPQSVGKPR